MFRRQEDDLDPTDSRETESMVMVSIDASLDLLAHTSNIKKIKLLDKIDVQAPQYRDSRIRFCSYCGREFQSDKALGGHLRIHRQHKAKSKARSHHMKSSKPAKKHFSEEEDDGFSCFVCDDSFSSMRLLCQHMRSHREMDSNGVQQPTPSQERCSTSEADTTLAEGIQTVSPRNDQNQGYRIDLLKDIPKLSLTGKRGRKKTYTDKIDNKIYNVLPLSVYDGSAVLQMDKRHEDSQDCNQSFLTRKKQKTKEIMQNQDASTDSEYGAADCHEPDSESTVVVLGYSKQRVGKKTSMMALGLESRISDKSKSSYSHGNLKNPSSAKAVKIVHECEICGKTFQTGQALGGHKTCHRKNPAVDPFMGELVQRKAEEQSSGETGQARDHVTRMLLPGVLSGQADPSEESYGEHPKKLCLLGFDINIPYVG